MTGPELRSWLVAHGCVWHDPPCLAGQIDYAAVAELTGYRKSQMRNMFMGRAKVPQRLLKLIAALDAGKGVA